MQIGNQLKVGVTGQVIGEEEIELGIKVLRSKQFAPNKYVDQFEHDFAKFVGKRYGLFVNSGSSANLLATAGWLQKNKNEDNAVLPGVMFPTTLAPYIQLGYKVRLVDVEVDTLQAPGKYLHGTHTLGNYTQIDGGIEDSCDAMFPKQYKGAVQTFSLYPAHFLTAGGGGMVTTDDPELYRIMKSLMHWGKDCWCPLGSDNACGKRFDQQFGDMPYGYDHKYIYTYIGYNFASLEIGGAIGIEQLKKLPSFLDIRRRNFKKLYEGLQKFESVFVLPRTILPDTAWFAFPITIKKEAKFSRHQLVGYLDSNGVGCRPIMGGNIKRQPAYKDIAFEDVVDMPNADIITEQSFYIGCWHGLSDEQIEYSVDTISKFVEKNG